MAEVLVLTDPRLPGLLRKVCAYAGLATPATGERFVVRPGAEPPALLAEFFEEALVEDAAEVVVWQDGDAPDYAALGDGGLAVQVGTAMSCPAEAELRAAVGRERALLFAVERRDAAGQLLGVTWAAVPEGEPAPTAALKAAVVRVDAGGLRTATRVANNVSDPRSASLPTGPACSMPTNPDPAVIDTTFLDPAELAAQAAAARAASAQKDEDKTEELRPLRATKAAPE